MASTTSSSSASSDVKDVKDQQTIAPEVMMKTKETKEASINSTKQSDLSSSPLTAEEEAQLASFNAADAVKLAKSFVNTELSDKFNAHKHKCVEQIKRAIAAGKKDCDYVVSDESLRDAVSATPVASANTSSKDAKASSISSRPTAELNGTFYKHFLTELKFIVGRPTEKDNHFTIRWDTEEVQKLTEKQLRDKVRQADCSGYSTAVDNAGTTTPPSFIFAGNGSDNGSDGANSVFTVYHAALSECERRKMEMEEVHRLVAASCIRKVFAEIKAAALISAKNSAASASIPIPLFSVSRPLSSLPASSNLSSVSSSLLAYLDYEIGYGTHGITRDAEKVLVFDKLVQELRRRGFEVGNCSKLRGSLRIHFIKPPTITITEGASCQSTQQTASAADTNGEEKKSSRYEDLKIEDYEQALAAVKELASLSDSIARNECAITLYKREQAKIPVPLSPTKCNAMDEQKRASFKSEIIKREQQNKQLAMDLNFVSNAILLKIVNSKK